MIGSAGFMEAPNTHEGKNTDLPVSYARPRTRGELAKLLKTGVACEVVSTNVDVSVMLLEGWLGIEKITVRPSENEGWSVFESGIAKGKETI